MILRRCAGGVPAAVLILRVMALACVLIGAGCKESFREEGFKEVVGVEGRNMVRLGGSDSAMPVLKTVAREFARHNTHVHIDFAVPMHSHAGVTGVAEGDYDLGLVSRSLSREEKDLGLQYFHLAQEGICFATHPGVGLSGLSSRQIIDIYGGKITDWAELGGAPGRIVVLDRPEYSSPKVVLRQRLLPPAFEVRSDAIVLERPVQMDESIAAIDGAIGFTSLSSLLSTGKRVTLLDVDDRAPTPRNVSLGVYPLWRPVGMVMRHQAAEYTMRFLDFTFGETGRQIMLGLGYAPVRAGLVIGVLPEREALMQERRYALMQRYLRQKLGSLVGVEIRHLSAYDDIIDYFMRQEVNAAFLDGYSFLLAKSQLELEPLVRPQREGVSTYRALLLARKDAVVSDWRDLRGKRLALVPFTTAGDLFPRQFFHRHGVTRLESFFGDVVDVGTHDTAVASVLKGELDAAGVKDSVFRRVVGVIPSAGEQVSVLAASKPLPEETLVVVRDLRSVCFNCHRRERQIVDGEHEDVLARVGDLPRLLQEIFLGLGQDKEGRAVLKEFGADGFVRAREEDYRAVCDVVGQAGARLEACLKARPAEPDRSSRGQS